METNYDNVLFPEDEEQENGTIITDDVTDKEVTIDDWFEVRKDNNLNKPKIDIDFETTDLINEDDIIQLEHQHEKDMLSKIEEFEIQVWDESNDGLKFKDPKMDKALNGLQAGFHIIAGCSNHGKSALLTDIEVGLLESNDDLYILSFSLDDSYEEKFSRVAAVLNNTTINFIKNPRRYNIRQEEDDSWYVRWKNSITKTKTFCDKYSIWDGSYTYEVEEIENKIKDTLATLETINLETGVKKKLVVVIDSFHDLCTKQKTINKNDDSRFEYIAKWARGLKTKYKIPVICTAELKKINAHRRPILDDIRDAIKIQYAAQSIILVYNEVSQKSEGSHIFYNVNGESGKKPVLECYFAKNKFTEFKGRLYYLFKPEAVKLVPANKENESKWNSKIYG